MDLLTAADRCDRCGAQAYVSATIHRVALLFCGHHYREHGAKLAEQGALIHDESTPLATTTSSHSG